MIPEEFLMKMKQQLSDDYEAFCSAYQRTPYHGYRLNQTKGKLAGLEEEELRAILGCPLDEQVPWCRRGYYQTIEGMGKHPFYFAGLYYIQEPSAMLPAELLAPQKGERILDLCAAPGGKSTQLLDAMEDEGLLVSNDISPSRGKAIVRNLERFGFSHYLVTAESPEKLAESFPGYFDAILVDAPCSGEGMFRREPDMGQEWISKGPSYYAPIQRTILTQALAMLHPGGRLVYSTCTFSQEEDEDNVRWFLETYPELSLEKEYKIMPHTNPGEGQYAALLRLKSGEEEISEGKNKGKSEKKTSYQPGNFSSGKDSLGAFLSLISPDWLSKKAAIPFRKEDQLYLLPREIDSLKKLRFLRTGLLAGNFKKERFEPSQALAMSLWEEVFANTVSFSIGDERVSRYLKGETISCENAAIKGKDGWCLVLMEHTPLGFAKRTGDSLKNKLDPGWRLS